jgi:hypothetical protein
MSMHRKNKCKDGARHRSDYSPWFWPSVVRRRGRKFGKLAKKFKRFVLRVKPKPARNLGRQGKQRGLDGTMFGPFRSRGV